MTHNYVTTKGAVALDEKMTRLRSCKPFTRCVQCSCSRYTINHLDERVFVCKKPNHRQVVINPNDRVAGCPYAKRHTNYDALCRVVVAAIEEERSKTTTTAQSPFPSMGRGYGEAGGERLL